MSETRIEWGAELTWPDGHSEVLGYHTDERRLAETRVNSQEYREDLPKVTARLVQRTVVVGDWGAVEEPEPEPDERGFTVLVGTSDGDPIEVELGV